MNNSAHTRNLSRAKRWLIERCQDINFGSLTFYVHSGEPDAGRPHHITRTLKLVGGDNGPRAEAGIADFELRREHLSLLERLSTLPDSTCVKVKLAHGLPGASIDIEEDHQAA